MVEAVYVLDQTRRKRKVTNVIRATLQTCGRESKPTACMHIPHIINPSKALWPHHWVPALYRSTTFEDCWPSPTHVYTGEKCQAFEGDDWKRSSLRLLQFLQVLLLASGTKLSGPTGSAGGVGTSPEIGRVLEGLSIGWLSLHLSARDRCSQMPRYF
jgi:hypothetical protein